MPSAFSQRSCLPTGGHPDRLVEARGRRGCAPWTRQLRACAGRSRGTPRTATAAACARGRARGRAARRQLRRRSRRRRPSARRARRRPGPRRPRAAATAPGPGRAFSIRCARQTSSGSAMKPSTSDRRAWTSRARDLVAGRARTTVAHARRRPAAARSSSAMPHAEVVLHRPVARLEQQRARPPSLRRRHELAQDRGAALARPRLGRSRSAVPMPAARRRRGARRRARRRRAASAYATIAPPAPRRPSASRSRSSAGRRPVRRAGPRA